MHLSPSLFFICPSNWLIEVYKVVNVSLQVMFDEKKMCGATLNVVKFFLCTILMSMLSSPIMYIKGRSKMYLNLHEE